MEKKQTHILTTKNIISFILAFVLIVPFGFSFPAPAQAANTQIRQEINITDAYYFASANTYATSSEIVAVTDNSYTSPYYYFEVVASTTAATNATVKLVNATSSATVATVTVNGGNTYARYRSAAFLPNASTTVEYAIVLGNENIGKGIIASRIVVLQNSATLAKTETQIEIGSATTTATNTTTLPLQSPKYWYYDATKWNGSPTFYAEVSYKVSPVASSTTYDVSATTTPTFSTYIGSPGVGYVVGEAWGGGGGGDGATSANTIGGGGGGGGTYARATTTVAVGSVNKIGIGRGGAEGVVRAGTASSTLTTAEGLVLAAQGGEGATTASGAATSTLGASIGGVIYAGGKGGNGHDTTDTGGGGGGAAGPHGYGITGGNAGSSGPGGTGGNGNFNLGGAGGAGGSGDAAPDTCDAENGRAGVNNVLGGGGGGGADGDVSSSCPGGAGGRPGGGGGGSDEGAGSTTVHIGGPGQVKITEWIGTVGVALEESDGTEDGFTGWAFKAQIVAIGKTSTTTERVRSVAFTPTSGRNYRITASTTNATASYNIYNAKIVVTQTGTPTLLQPQYLLANTKFANNTSLQKFLNYWNPAEWSTTNAYIFQAETANGSASVVGLNAAEGTQIAGSFLSSPDNRATSTALCMPYVGDLDTQATTNNNDVYASRILVDVGGTPSSCGVSSGTRKIRLNAARLRSVRLR